MIARMKRFSAMRSFWSFDLLKLNIVARNAMKKFPSEIMRFKYVNLSSIEQQLKLAVAI